MATNSGSSTLPTVVIVGAGAAGIFTAYQIALQCPGQFDVQVFEAGPTIGGNVSTVTVQYGGQFYSIDAGAEFYYPNPQPNYTQLVTTLGLSSASYPAGFTIWESSSGQRLLWVPSTLGGFLQFSASDWEAMINFCGFIVAALLLNIGSPSNWTLSVSDWLAEMQGLISPGFAPVVSDFLYQFVSLPLNQIGESSALYATTYFIRNIIGTPASATAALTDDIPTFSTYQNNAGLLTVLQAALTASGATARTSAPVTAVAPGSGGVTVTVGGTPINASYVVLACDPNTSSRLLAAGQTASQDLIQLLAQFPYLELPIVLQQNGSCWMPSDQKSWEPVTTVVNTPAQTIAFNAWFGPLRPPYDGSQQIPVFKSWGAPALSAASCSSTFYSHTHNVLLPTTAFMSLRSQLLPSYQGQNGLFFAGGWTNWFDSQEAALLSGTSIAGTLSQSATGKAPVPQAAAGDPALLSDRVKQWLVMILARAPETQKGQLAALITRIP